MLQKLVLLREYLETASNPYSSESLAKSFQNRYQELKDSGDSADTIFRRMQEYVGFFDGSASKQVASMAVLAYFFERCDIFENPDAKSE